VPQSFARGPETRFSSLNSRRVGNSEVGQKRRYRKLAEQQFPLHSAPSWMSSFSELWLKVAIHRRYTDHPLLGVPYELFTGITVRPVPCN
jgi:hypothetical protein